MPLHCCKKHAGWLAFMMLLFAPAASWADNKAAAIDEMEGYLEFVDYGGGVIFAEQIPKDEWPRMVVIDARDATQFAKNHIPGAIPMDCRVACRNGRPRGDLTPPAAPPHLPGTDLCPFCRRRPLVHDVHG